MNLSDFPITKNEDDLFNFKHYAKKVQKIIQNNSDNTEPLTIGVYGKWGEGKTSFLNLVEKQIDLGEKVEGQKGVLKYHFNPWRYSTEDEMLFDFFDGLSKMMLVEQDTKVQKIAKRITEYYNYIEKIKLKGKVGLTARIIYSLANIFKKKDITLDKLIEAINTKLKDSKYKIVVFVDDIDRLDKDEIYTILKLIKLNANFNNFVYIVALDENHVAKAIGQRYGVNTEDGKLFLEKIINIPIHLPKIETADFKRFFKIKLEEIFDSLGFSDRNDREEQEFGEVIREFRVQYFKNGREVIRVLNSFFVSAFAIGDEVNLRDLFWIEYLKITDNIAFDVIKKYNFPNSEKELITDNAIIKYSTDILNKDEKFKYHSKKIIEMLFSNFEGLMVGRVSNNDKKPIEISKVNLKINHPNHFEKYFSYHMEGKSSVVKNSQIFQYIFDKKEEELKNALIDLINKDNLEVHRLYSVIEDLINEENINYLFFYDFLFSNLDLLPETETDSFGLTYRLRVIELIAFNLDKKNVDKDDIIQLAKKLTIYHLCYFTRKINLKIETRNELDKLIVCEVKEEYVDKSIPFFYDLTKEHLHYKMIMSLWKDNDEDSFSEYIDKKTKNIESITKLIRNFPGFWNNEFHGNLEKDNYDFMKKIIDVDAIYKKIEEYNPNLMEKIDSAYSLSIIERPSELENVEQFIFWYKKDNNLLN